MTLPMGLMAQSPSSPFLRTLETFNIQPYVQFQLWSTYTHGQEYYLDSLQEYQPASNRFNTQLRRGRFGFSGKPYERLSFNLTGAIDLVGRDVYSGTDAGTNPASPNPKVLLWQAFLDWRISPHSDRLHLNIGYMPPQFSRATIVSAFSSTSFEKSFSQNYVRRHLTGNGPGRAMGIDLGGLVLGKKGIGLLYHVGVYNPQNTGFRSSAAFGNTAGEKAEPLWAGKASLQIGEPDIERYKLFVDVNAYGQRKGLTLSLSGSYQGETDRYMNSYGIGTDFAFNWGPVNVDGEWSWLYRSGESANSGSLQAFTYGNEVGFLRGSYNLWVKDKYLLEPTFMIMHFSGGKSEREQAEAALVGSDSGSESLFNLGINYYLNKRDLKLSLHYVWREGDPGFRGAGATVNNHFRQNPAGAIRRGDYLGLGLQVLLK